MGLPDGAPQSACIYMIPAHGRSRAIGTVPYIVNISSLDGGYVPGQRYSSEY